MTMYRYLFDNDEASPNLDKTMIYKDIYDNGENTDYYMLEVDIDKVAKQLNISFEEARPIVSAIAKSIIRLKYRRHEN